MSPIGDAEVFPQARAGARAAVRPSGNAASSRLLRSLIAKLFLLLLVFVTVPVILYTEFQQADAEKRALLLESTREQGRLLAESLRPLVEREEPSPLLSLQDEVKRLSRAPMAMKVLFRPRGEVGAESFYFVAAEPAVPPSDLEVERDRLIERGVFTNLVSSCAGELPIALRHGTSGGAQELLTSITPINTPAGCWVVVTAHDTGAFLGTAIGQPYWNTLEVRVAGGIYIVMAVLTIGVFFSIWRSLMRFRNLARGIRTGVATGTSFEQQNRVPELAVVAGEFDRMTRALQDSSESIRRAAEDNAHAFKTPIAIMRQSLEPLRRIVPFDNVRGQRALDVLEESVDRLDYLVACARHLDESTAELIDAPRDTIDLSRLVGRMLDAYADSFMSRLVYLDTKIRPGVKVQASEELLETVIENVVDNALSVAPEGSGITVELAVLGGEHAQIVVRDQGPGVSPRFLRKIFERYVSMRPRAGQESGGEENSRKQAMDNADSHPGIGLWIVRRNLEAVGGRVWAENQDSGGLAVYMRLPLAR